MTCLGQRVNFSSMSPDLREEAPGLFVPDPLAHPLLSAGDERSRVLAALWSARQVGDRVLANRLLGELVELTEQEKRMLQDV